MNRLFHFGLIATVQTIIGLGSGFIIPTLANTSVYKIQPILAQVDNQPDNKNEIPWTPILLILVLMGCPGIIYGILLMKHGFVDIEPEKVGLRRKKYCLKFWHPKLPSDKQIALNGEPGWEGNTLASGRNYLGFWPWQYEVDKVDVTQVPSGQIALVYANDGESIPTERVLGKSVECDNFTNAEKFLKNGGQKGRQMSILREGKWRINTKLFTVITADKAREYGLSPSEQLKPYTVERDMIGIVTTTDGVSPLQGKIAGPIIEGHDNFQNGQRFIEQGGWKGLQEEFLNEGLWYLNPWFVRVEQEKVTYIPGGTVGVIISHVGKESQEPNKLVDEGYKGTQKNPLWHGRHPVNTRVKDIEIVPTHQITLDWTKKKESDDKERYDAKLGPIKLRSQDGFEFDVEVTQIIQIDGFDAPEMISKIGYRNLEEKQEPTSLDDSGPVRYRSIRSLVIRVLEPQVGSFFKDAGYQYEALQYHKDRSARQLEAKEHIKKELGKYGVTAVDTCINEIDLPPKLEQLLQERKLVEERGENWELKQTEAEKKLEFQRTDAEAQKIPHMVAAQAEAAQIRETGIARAEARKAQAEAFKAEVEAYGGPEYYLEHKRTESIAKINVPQTLINSNGSDNAGILQTYQAYLAQFMGQPREKASDHEAKAIQQEELEKLPEADPWNEGPITNPITIEPGKRGGKPCIRGMRITVHDILEYLAAGMSHEEILEDFPYLTEDDIRACLRYAAT